jgi:hypothetical protein
VKRQRPSRAQGVVGVVFIVAMMQAVIVTPLQLQMLGVLRCLRHRWRGARWAVAAV